ncbi:TPA: hypothetical protein PC496_000769 [Clostridioides difficile]|nr:hypothetical protein [Clostridioides difficile]
MVTLNEQCDFDYNNIYELTEEKQLKIDTPYIITGIETEFNMQELTRNLYNLEKEIEGELLYQLYNIETETYCGVLVNNESINKI